MARQASGYITCQHCGKRFRAISCFHLRNIHGYESEHPVCDYKSEFDLRYATCRESRKKLSEWKTSFWRERGQHWTPEAVLSEIRGIDRVGGSLRPKDVPGRLELAARRLFGGWQTAVEKAGLDYEQTAGAWRWSAEKVMETIRELAERGIPLYASYVKEHYPTLYTAAVKRFSGSWAKALQATGFDPNEHRQQRGRWNKGDVVGWVRKQVAKGKSILARDVPRDLLRSEERR